MRAESSKVLVVRRLLFKFGWYAYNASRVPVQLGPKAAADVPGEVRDFTSDPSGGKFTSPSLPDQGRGPGLRKPRPAPKRQEGDDGLGPGCQRPRPVGADPRRPEGALIEKYWSGQVRLGQVYYSAEV